MNILKKWNIFILMIVLMLTIFTVPVSAEIRPKKRKKIPEQTTVILFVNTQKKLNPDNLPINQRIKWSSNNKKIATVTQKGKVTAKKAGKAKITAKSEAGKHTFVITVKKKVKLKNTKGKKASDISALKKIIETQILQGATVSTNLNNTSQYIWNEKGRLTELRWNKKKLKGSLSLAKFSSLTVLECSENKLTSLNVSSNASLVFLCCKYNRLTYLDVSNNTKLEDLICDKTVKVKK